MKRDMRNIFTPNKRLYRAVKFRYDDGVSRALKDGADPDYTPKDMYPPLVLAACYKQSSVVTQLLDAGGKVNLKDYRGGTALQRAAERGHTAICRLLLDRGAFVNVADKFGTTPLHEAAFGAWPRVVSMLIAAGAELDVVDSNGRTPRALIERHFTPPQAKNLLAGVPEEVTETQTELPCFEHGLGLS